MECFEWEKVQGELVRRREAKGIIQGDTSKYSNRYELTGKLFCSKCGFSLIRRTWNSKLNCKKIVWQCSNYIRHGKASCSGTTIDDEIISKLKIEEETVVKEVIKDGKKHYIYTSKNEQLKPSREPRTPEKENGSLLQSIDRSVRTSYEA